MSGLGKLELSAAESDVDTDSGEETEVEESVFGIDDKHLNWVDPDKVIESATEEGNDCLEARNPINQNPKLSLGYYRRGLAKYMIEKRIILREDGKKPYGNFSWKCASLILQDIMMKPDKDIERFINNLDIPEAAVRSVRLPPNVDPSSKDDQEKEEETKKVDSSTPINTEANKTPSEAEKSSNVSEVDRKTMSEQVPNRHRRKLVDEFDRCCDASEKDSVNQENNDSTARTPPASMRINSYLQQRQANTSVRKGRRMRQSRLLETMGAPNQPYKSTMADKNNCSENGDGDHSTIVDEEEDPIECTPTYIEAEDKEREGSGHNPSSDDNDENNSPNLPEANSTLKTHIIDSKKSRKKSNRTRTSRSGKMKRRSDYAESEMDGSRRNSKRSKYNERSNDQKIMKEDSDEFSQDEDPDLEYGDRDREIQGRSKPKIKLPENRIYSLSTTKQKNRLFWTENECNNLRRGVKKYGVGEWQAILHKYKFHKDRTNVDLKDKYRNLSKK